MAGSPSDQGVVLKHVNGGGRPLWLIGGGSPVATLWAVYELVERLGVRFLLSGDVFPDLSGAPSLPEVDEHREPVFHDRIWRVMNDEPTVRRCGAWTSAAESSTSLPR